MPVVSVCVWGGIQNEMLGGNPAASVRCYITLSCQGEKMSKLEQRVANSSIGVFEEHERGWEDEGRDRRR